MPDAASRTDLFKALNHFMAVLAAYAPGSHREDVVLEVGDAAFRAFERALCDGRGGARESVTGGDLSIQTHTPSGRVVIRKRDEPARCCSWDTDGDGERPRHPKTGPFVRAQREAELEREGAAAKDQKRRCTVAGCGNPPFLTHPTCFSHYAPTDTKPTARAHLKGCVLDTDHLGPCYDAEEVKGFRELADRRAKEGHVPAGAPRAAGAALSPRQALGEALACVERARDLFLGVAADPAVGMDVRLAALNGYQSALNAWGSTTSARSHLAQQETKE